MISFSFDATRKPIAKIVKFELKSNKNGKPYGVARMQSAYPSKVKVEGEEKTVWRNSTWFAIFSEKAVEGDKADVILSALAKLEKFDNGVAKGGFPIEFNGSIEMVQKTDEAGVKSNQISMTVWDWQKYVKPEHVDGANGSSDSKKFMQDSGFVIEEPDFD